MGKQKKTRDELEAETTKWVTAWTTGTKTVTTLIKTIGVGFCFYWVYRGIDSLAGKTTLTNMLFEMATDLKMNQWFGYILGGTGITYGLQQRHLRRKNISRIAPRNDALEKRVDPNKMSSGLTQYGTTEGGSNGF